MHRQKFNNTREKSPKHINTRVLKSFADFRETQYGSVAKQTKEEEKKKR
jgi:hypothetical protein